MYPQDVSTCHLLGERGWTASFCLFHVLNDKLTPPSLTSSEIDVWVLGYGEEHLAPRKQFQGPGAILPSLKQLCVFQSPRLKIGYDEEWIYWKVMFVPFYCKSETWHTVE